MTVYTCVCGVSPTQEGKKFDKPNLERGIAYVNAERWNDCEVRTPPDLFKDPRRNSRMVKVLSHLFIKEEWSLWVDGSVVVKCWGDLEAFKQLGDLVIFKHQQRQCIYQEAKAVLKHEKDTPKVVNEQMERYKAEDYPVNNGLIHSSTILRRHTKEIIEFNNRWWAEICRHSVRDQLSFNYVAWKMGIKIGYFPAESDFEVTRHGA
jgi:hypothetical protein